MEKKTHNFLRLSLTFLLVLLPSLAYSSLDFSRRLGLKQKYISFSIGGNWKHQVFDMNILITDSEISAFRQGLQQHRFDSTRSTELSWRPRAFIYEGFLSDKECDHLINLAEGKLEKSMVADTETGMGVESEQRTSSGMFLFKAQDETVANIEARIAAWTFIPVENGESIQILQYEKGQKYDPHFDFFTDQFNLAFGGNRISTVLMYLSNVEKGGETVFPASEIFQPKDHTWSDCAKQGYAVKPRKGDALLFFSLHPNATIDERSLHGSCPVIEGEKWSATKWIHVSSLKAAYKHSE